MRQVLLVRFGEVHLKGQNRPYFLHKLTDNVKKAVAPLNARVWLSDGRIYVSDFEDIQQAIDRVTRVFGLYSVSPAWELDKDYDLIARKCEEMTRGLKGTFKVMARRSDKHFPMNSQQLNAELGGVILDANPDLRVDVHKPDYYVSVEIRDHAYIYIDEIMAVGGMPMGTGGKAMLLLSGGIDSPVAGFQLMRRGVNINAVHFFSFPYTSERAKEKVLELAKILGSYGGGMKVYIVPLITGESLGQVAIQTMEALGCTDAVVNMPVFRPLIGLDKLEITQIATKIGTYETSILPYEDCCTVFTPRHPMTKPKIEALIEAEQALDTEALVREAVENTEGVLV